jgi:hypothetical protein
MSGRKQVPEPDRASREYPHGSGDRNAWSPFGKDRMPIHEGGSQRDAPTDTPDADTTSTGPESSETSRKTQR